MNKVDKRHRTIYPFIEIGENGRVGYSCQCGKYKRYVEPKIVRIGKLTIKVHPQ